MKKKSFRSPTGPSKFAKGLTIGKLWKTRKWLYLSILSSKWKNKGTFFSPTFKVEGNKVPLFFHFELKWAKYGNFFVFKLFKRKYESWKKWNRPYLTQFGLNWKNKGTLLSSTLKVWEIKVLLFFHFKLKQTRYGHFYVL